MLMKTGILYFTTCFHGFGILRHVDPFVRMLHILALTNPLTVHNVTHQFKTSLCWRFQNAAHFAHYSSKNNLLKGASYYVHVVIVC